MIIDQPGPIQPLNAPYRLNVEARPITVKPYMITERDLSAIGHAQCQLCSRPLIGDPKTPRWLVNGWASCDRHLGDVVRSASEFNRRHQIWAVDFVNPVDELETP